MGKLCCAAPLFTWTCVCETELSFMNGIAESPPPLPWPGGSQGAGLTCTCFFVLPALPWFLPHLPPQGHFLVPRGLLTAVPLVHALASPGLKVGQPLSGLPGRRWVFVASAN